MPGSAGCGVWDPRACPGPRRTPEAAENDDRGVITRDPGRVRLRQAHGVQSAPSAMYARYVSECRV